MAVSFTLDTNNLQADADAAARDATGIVVADVLTTATDTAEPIEIAELIETVARVEVARGIADAIADTVMLSRAIVDARQRPITGPASRVTSLRASR